MILKTISVPEYVANDFERPLNSVNREGLSRVYRLVNLALQGIAWPEWEVADRKFHSKNSNEPFGLEEIDGKFYIFAEQRGVRTALAVFKDDHLAAKYFVWLVSDGTRQIDWSQ